MKVVHLIVLFVLLLFSKSSLSQDTLKSQKEVWANIGGGAAFLLPDNSGLHIGIGYSQVRSNHLLLGGELHVASDIFTSGPGVFALGGGIGNSGKWFNTGIFVGPALVFAYKSITVGASSTAQITCKLMPGLGVGMEAFVDINALQNVTGLRLVLQLNGPD